MSVSCKLTLKALNDPDSDQNSGLGSGGEPAFSCAVFLTQRVPETLGNSLGSCMQKDSVLYAEMGWGRMICLIFEIMVAFWGQSTQRKNTKYLVQ